MVGRIRFELERWDSPRHSFHVAQLWSLGVSAFVKHIMKKYIAILVAALAFAATSCSTTRCCHSSPNLAGNWEMAGPYNVGQPCQILQSGNYLTFINEKGDRARGVLKSPAEVIAIDWEGGLSGVLTNKATRINWKNGTWWLRGN